MPILKQIEKESAGLSCLVSRLARAPSQLAGVVNGLVASQGSARFRYAKVLLRLSERAPALLYPHFEAFERLLDDANQIVRWNAIRILGNLAPADAEGRIERLLDRYLSPIEGPVMVTAANVIAGAAQIARAKPHLAPRVIAAILTVERAKYRTRECRNVALGHALTALRSLGPEVATRPDVLALARRQTRNPRLATRRKAVAFLKQRGQSQSVAANPVRRPGRLRSSPRALAEEQA